MTTRLRYLGLFAAGAAFGSLGMYLYLVVSRWGAIYEGVGK